ncbi:hypothetical protein JCM10049v2_007352 [Rhodotorula toruloides]
MDHRDVAEQLEAGGGQGEAAGSAGGNEMSPRQDGQAPPVPIDGHRLSFTSALKDWFTRSPLSPRTPRQSPRTSPRTPHSGSSTTPRARWSTSSHSHENPYFPPTSSHVAHPPNVASTSRPHPKRPSRPRSTSAPTGDVPTLQKKGFLARMRLKLGHPGESAVTPANLNPAVVSPGFEQPPASIPAPKVPPFRRAASGPARLLDRNHRERQRRNAGIAVHVQQEEESDRASTPPDVSTLPICCNDAHNYAQTTDTFGDVFADPPSTNDEFDRNSFPVSDDGPGLVSSFPGTQESPTATRDITRSVTRSTSSSPTPRATASGSSSIECFHPFLGAPIYDGPLRVQTRPSSMRQQAYGASWTGLSLGLAPSEQTAGVLSAASTSSRNNRAYSDVWPPPGLVSRFSDWTPTEPERRSSYHSSVFVSLIARHNLGLSLGVVRHPGASNRDFRPLLTQSSRQRILSLRKKRSAAALVDWPSLEVAAPPATQPRYSSITSRSRLPLWPYSLSSRSPSRKTAEPSIVCAREDEAWLRESRPASKRFKMRMVSVGVQTE